MLYTAKHCRMIVEQQSHLGHGKSSLGDLTFGCEEKARAVLLFPEYLRTRIQEVDKDYGDNVVGIC